jgi:hypothetical protein
VGLVRNTVLAGAMTAALVALASGCGASSGGSLHPSVHATATPKPAATSPGTASGAPAAAPPAGYNWVGSAAQGIWFAVPASWAAVNLAKVSASQALSHFALKGVSSSYLKAALTGLSQRHAIFVVDLGSAGRSAQHFASNGSAVCGPTALVPGASASSALQSLLQAQYARFHAHIVSMSSAAIAGGTQVKADIRLTSTAGLTVSETQYAVLSTASRLCVVTLTTDNPAAFQPVFNKIGGSIRVS